MSVADKRFVAAQAEAQALLDACEGLTEGQWQTVGERHLLLEPYDNFSSMIARVIAPRPDAHERYVASRTMARDWWAQHRPNRSRVSGEYFAFASAVTALMLRQDIDGALAEQMGKALASVAGNTPIPARKGALGGLFR